MPQAHSLPKDSMQKSISLMSPFVHSQKPQSLVIKYTILFPFFQSLEAKIVFIFSKKLLRFY